MERRKDRHENRNKRQRWSYSRRPGIWRKKQSRHDGEHARTFYEKRQVSVQVLTLPWLCVISFILLIFLKKSDTHWFIWIAFFLKLRKQNLYQSGRLQSMGSQRVGYNSVTRNTCMWVTEELRDVEVYLHSNVYMCVCVCIYIYIYIYLLVQFIRSVMSDSLQPHGLQHARRPGPSPAPRACSNSCPSSW